MRNPIQKFCRKVGIELNTGKALFTSYKNKEFSYSKFSEFLDSFNKTRNINLPYHKTYYFLQRYDEYLNKKRRE
jgi:hypothetical protein